MNRLSVFTDRPQPMPCTGAGWITRSKLRSLTPVEQEVLRDWISVSPKHRGRDYIRAETIWRLSGGLAAYPDVQAEVAHLLERPLPSYTAAVPLRADPKAAP